MLRSGSAAVGGEVRRLDAARRARLHTLGAAAPPITPPEGSTCTFAKGLTTCVQTTGIVTVSVLLIPDDTCPTGFRLRVTRSSETTTTTTVFSGMHQLGEPTTVTTRTGATTSEECE